MLLGSCGVIGAWLLWRALAGAIPIDPSASGEGVRLGQAALALVPGALVLWATTLVQAGARFLCGAADPLAGRETAFLRLNQRVIANTVEQLCVFAPMLLAAAGLSGAAELPRVLALGGVFAAARLAFWGGYLVHPVARAAGMAATLAATAAAAGMVLQGLGWGAGLSLGG